MSRFGPSRVEISEFLKKRVVSSVFAVPQLAMFPGPWCDQFMRGCESHSVSTSVPKSFEIPVTITRPLTQYMVSCQDHWLSIWSHVCFIDSVNNEQEDQEDQYLTISTFWPAQVMSPLVFWGLEYPSSWWCSHKPVSESALQHPSHMSTQEWLESCVALEAFSDWCTEVGYPSLLSFWHSKICALLV